MSDEAGAASFWGRVRVELICSRGMAVALGLAAVVAVLRILTHHPFFDECLHVHNLWALSEGLVPHRDFWCNYPVPAYVLTLPIFEALPRTAFSLFGLRLAMLGPIAGTAILLGIHGRRTGWGWVWGAAPIALVVGTPPLGRFLAEYSIDPFAMVAAAGAIALIFARPRPFRAGAAAALALLSVAMTPKYALPLLLGVSGLAAGTVIATRRVLPTLLALLAGAGAAALLVLLLYGLGGTSPVENLEYSHLLMGRFKLARDAAPVSLLSSTMRVLLRNVPLLLLVAAGIAGWVKWIRGRLLARGLAPLGLLVGALATAIVTKTYMIQYVLPVILCLAAFAPFGRHLAGTGIESRLVTPALTVVTLGAAVVALAGVAGEFEKTPVNVRDEEGLVVELGGLQTGPPAVKSLAGIQRLLDRIPPGERVVAAPPESPLFRRDLTAITADERPSFQTLLDPDDPMRARFDPRHLARRLAETPPAYICLTGLEDCAPPGWRAVLEDFLRRNAARYVPVPDRPDAYLRADLAR